MNDALIKQRSIVMYFKVICLLFAVAVVNFVLMLLGSSVQFAVCIDIYVYTVSPKTWLL